MAENSMERDLDRIAKGEDLSKTKDNDGSNQEISNDGLSSVMEGLIPTNYTKNKDGKNR